jgi:NADH:ubiquinone oxidoreductase subunit 2 (subunit N)
MLIFLLSLGGIPFVAGFWAKLYVFWRPSSAAFMASSSSAQFSRSSRSITTCSSRAGCTSNRRASPSPYVWPPLLGAAIVICLLGVIGIGVYPAPWVDMALRVASTLF